MEPIVLGGLVVIVVVIIVGVVLYRQKEKQKQLEAAQLAAAKPLAGRRKRSIVPDDVVAKNDEPSSDHARVIVPLPPAADQDEQDQAARRQAVQDVTEGTSHDPASALQAALHHEGVPFEHARQSDKRLPLVLVVDDSKSALLSATRALKDQPYRVVTADNGMAALSKLEQEKPALVITDVDMPQLDGFGLLRRMRNDLRFNDIPVIMVTGHLHLHVQIGADEGVNGFVPKPYDPQNLVDQVKYCLGD